MFPVNELVVTNVLSWHGWLRQDRARPAYFVNLNCCVVNSFSTSFVVKQSHHTNAEIIQIIKTYLLYSGLIICTFITLIFTCFRRKHIRNYWPFLIDKDIDNIISKLSFLQIIGQLKTKAEEFLPIVFNGRIFQILRETFNFLPSESFKGE